MAIINYLEKHLKTFTVKAHRHNYWEIIYVTDGGGTIETADQQIIEYKKDEIICIPPYLQHINNSSVGFKNIHLTIEDWTPPTQKAFLIPESNSSKDFCSILKLAYRYFHQLPANHPINLAYTNMIEVFLNTLSKKTISANITQVLIDEIINNYTDSTFDLEQAYKLTHFSKEHVRKLFIKEHGISPSKFLLQCLHYLIKLKVLYAFTCCCIILSENLLLLPVDTIQVEYNASTNNTGNSRHGLDKVSGKMNTYINSTTSPRKDTGVQTGIG